MHSTTAAGTVMLCHDSFVCSPQQGVQLSYVSNNAHALQVLRTL
jgi:hypothetical protein